MNGLLVLIEIFFRILEKTSSELICTRLYSKEKIGRETPVIWKKILLKSRLAITFGTISTRILQLQAVTELVPELIWAPKLFGPQEIWSPKNLGPRKFGPQEIWAPEIWSPHLFGPREIWSPRKLVPRKFGPQEIWSPRNLVPRKFGPQEIWSPGRMVPPKLCQIWKKSN